MLRIVYSCCNGAYTIRELQEKFKRLYTEGKPNSVTAFIGGLGSKSIGWELTCQGHGFIDIGAEINEIMLTLTLFNFRMSVVMP